MSNKYKFRDNKKLYFVTFSIVYWIDVFIRVDYKNILIDSIKYCIQEKGLEVYGYCIMTSHVHLIIGSNKERTEGILRDLKSFTSRSLKAAIKENNQESRKEWMIWMMERAGKKTGRKSIPFWQEDSHPIELYDKEVFLQKLNYIHNNPVEAGFVESPEEYLYSSARNYANKRAVMEICHVD